jgi:hypothetical protein
VALVDQLALLDLVDPLAQPDLADLVDRPALGAPQDPLDPAALLDQVALVELHFLEWPSSHCWFVSV